MKIKSIITALFLAAVFLLPVSLNAQSDGFFRGGEGDNYSDRASDVILDGSGMSLGSATYENPTAPIGSGLLIMVAAGAGYAALRCKRVRKTATLLLATVMLLTLTQCKKKNIVTTNTDEGVFITLNATYGGDKTVFDPAGLGFTWKQGVTEYIYVGGSQHNGYLGVLSGTAGEAGHTEMSFSGELDKAPYSNETLYFYYLGEGYELIGYDINANSPKYIVDFSEQSGTLDDVTKYHIAIGQSAYQSSGEYHVNLSMAMSIACFDLTRFKDEANNYEDVYIHGDQIVAAATINFRNGTIGINGDEDGRLEEVGYIKCSKVTGSSDNKKYVALLPPTAPATLSGSHTIKFDSNSKTGSIDFNNGIQPGKFYADKDNNNYLGLNIVASNALINGTIPGLFSTGGEKIGTTNHYITTKMARFSKGNLQYDKVYDRWSFMDQQYNTVETTSQNVGTDYANQNIVSLFGWGTSGWNNGNLCYMPYNTSNSSSGEYSSSYGYGYGPKNVEATYPYQCSLTGDFANADWGVYNDILNGGNTSWRTPTKDELCYMIGVRDNNSAIHRQCKNRFLKAIITIDNVQYNGLIIFPDDFNAGSMVYNYNNYSNYDTDHETGYTPVTADDWNNMKSQCVVFLPAGGSRNGVSCSNVNSWGNYWTATQGGNSYGSALKFSNFKGSNTTFNGVQPEGSGLRYSGYSVRLIRDLD